MLKAHFRSSDWMFRSSLWLIYPDSKETTSSLRLETQHTHCAQRGDILFTPEARRMLYGCFFGLREQAGVVNQATVVLDALHISSTTSLLENILSMQRDSRRRP